MYIYIYVYIYIYMYIYIYLYMYMYIYMVDSPKVGQLPYFQFFGYNLNKFCLML